MDLVTVTLIIVAVWIGGVLVFVLGMCKASGHADAEEERYLAEGREDVPDQSLAPHATGRDHGGSIDRVELEREAERLRIELPQWPRLRATRLVGTRRDRS